MIRSKATSQVFLSLMFHRLETTPYASASGPIPPRILANNQAHLPCCPHDGVLLPPGSIRSAQAGSNPRIEMNFWEFPFDH